jgi:predicted MFS family arabinose efflux permease
MSTALIGDLGQREHQGRRLGTLFTAGDLASAAGPPLAFWLLPLVGLRGIYWSAAGLFALIFLFSAFWAFLLRSQQPAHEW